jgi:hypothetical protein
MPALFSAGETQRLLMSIKAEDLGYFDVEANAWKVEPLQATIMAGPPSRDLSLVGHLQVE